MGRTLLALNAGSSSLKFAAFEAAGETLSPLLRGEASGWPERPRLTAQAVGGNGAADLALPAGCGHDEAVRRTLDWLDVRVDGAVAGVGHRIVHGGPELHGPAVLDAPTLARLEALIPWAPLHQPAALAILEQAKAAWPGALQVGSFDTAFHHGQPAVARRLALPRALEAEGVRRYGFHGLSCQSAMIKLGALNPEAAVGRLLIAHLGSGCSLTAVKAGRSLDSSMGFSPLDGLVMSTRCGSLDPGVVLFLQLVKGLSAQEVEDMLYHRSGLLGVSGLSGDMRVLLQSPEPAARAAIDLFVFRAAREAGALAGSLEGLDAIVFTGGIGENAAAVRSALAARLCWLGLELDEAANAAAGDRLISPPASPVRAWVLAADEEAVIARDCAALLSASSQ